MAQPSLRALRAFAETIRCGTLAGASSSLNVTPSAVSHLLRELEQTLGLPLLTSRARPTDTGEHLGRRLIAAFDAIDSAVAAARHQADDIRISTLSTYLTLGWCRGWLASSSNFQKPDYCSAPARDQLTWYPNPSNAPSVGDAAPGRGLNASCCPRTAPSWSPTRGWRTLGTSPVSPRAPARTTGSWSPML